MFVLLKRFIRFLCNPSKCYVVDIKHRTIKLYPRIIAFDYAIFCLIMQKKCRCLLKLFHTWIAFINFFLNTIICHHFRDDEILLINCLSFRKKLTKIRKDVWVSSKNSTLHENIYNQKNNWLNRIHTNDTPTSDQNTKIQSSRFY